MDLLRVAWTTIEYRTIYTETQEFILAPATANTYLVLVINYFLYPNYRVYLTCLPEPLWNRQPTFFTDPAVYPTDPAVYPTDPTPVHLAHNLQSTQSPSQRTR